MTAEEQRSTAKIVIRKVGANRPENLSFIFKLLDLPKMNKVFKTFIKWE